MSTTHLRLVTFNIAHGRGLNPIQGLTPPRMVRANLLRIAKLLHEVKADIVAFQEIDQCSTWAGNMDQLKYLRTHARLPHSVYGITNEREGLIKLSYGNGLISRLPIFAADSFVFGRRKIGEKGFLYVELSVSGKIIPLINLHFHYRSRVQRLHQLAQLTDWIHLCHQERGSFWSIPPIVCGDFNASRSLSDVTTALLRNLRHFSDYRVYPHSGSTFPSPWPSRALDFIFLPAACHHAHASVIRSYLSDHRPVIVEFDLFGRS